MDIRQRQHRGETPMLPSSPYPDIPTLPMEETAIMPTRRTFETIQTFQVEWVRTFPETTDSARSWRFLQYVFTPYIVGPLVIVLSIYYYYYYLCYLLMLSYFLVMRFSLRCLVEERLALRGQLSEERDYSNLHDHNVLEVGSRWCAESDTRYLNLQNDIMHAENLKIHGNKWVMQASNDDIWGVIPRSKDTS